MKLLPVIISGGSGTRLWPVSREARPKPFMQMQDGLSLLQSTLARSAALPAVNDLLVVTNRDHHFQSREELETMDGALNGAQVSFLLEPVGRNTTAAVAMAAFLAAERYGEDTILLVQPADHLISDGNAFSAAVQAALPAAASGDFVTFGIVPTGPETGYGYIQCTATPKAGAANAVKRFVEKPDLEKAKAFVASGDYLWNSGMFCFRADAILGAVERFAPEIHAKTRESWQLSAAAAKDPAALNIESEVFPRVPSISIDYAVMEKAENVKVVPGRFGWSDIGSWRSISELVRPDAQGNRVMGEAVLVNSSDNYIQGEGRVIAAVGVKDLVIVDTPDALLVGHRDQTQSVKEVVDQLRKAGHEAAKLHRTVYRPWGTYTVVEEGPHYKMKRIVVKPHASLSLQMHRHRSEHWVVIAGVAEIVNGEQTLRLEHDQSTYIPAGNKHRLSNPGEEDLVIIEVQTGSYLGEDDIQRFDDIYGRTQ
ncbi:MAG TPA: mannose-1-phosphate guanylyltransferase/mannose-6-phosphate isomerase [Gammaproteobacteria bacterium]|nr:mannose-1-phosphate guanylyltransferase/mannose-6-phosphate isomerase [Gammaproteobacteria bacterium]